MGEHRLIFHIELDAKSRAMHMRVPIDITAAEADVIKRKLDELVNTRQPNEIHLQEIRDVCSRHGCTLDEIRVQQKRPRELVLIARTAIIRYLLSEGFSNVSIADFIHRDVSTVLNMRAKL